MPEGINRQRNDTLTAVCARLPRAADTPLMTRVEAVEGGWWYVGPVPKVGRVSGQEQEQGDADAELIVGFYADAAGVHEGKLSQPEVWLQELQKTQYIKQCIAASQKGGQGDWKGDLLLEVHPAFSSLLTAPEAWPEVPYAAAGDAAAARDPLSSSGIANALGTGVQAGRVAADALFGAGALGPAYRRALVQDHQTYLKAHWKTYAVEKRWPDHPFWRFRTAQVSRAPEALVKARMGVQGSEQAAGEGSIFLPRPIASWIQARAQQPCRQLDLMQGARQAFPDIPDERLLLGIEELTQAARPAGP